MHSHLTELRLNMTLPFTMEMIWYNPDLDMYQKGALEDYSALANSSENESRFLILYQFNKNSKKLAEKILSSLNLVRESRLAQKA